MFPLVEVSLAVLRTVPYVLLDPERLLPFLLLTALVALQYGRVEAMERYVYGRPWSSMGVRVGTAVAAGLVAGVLGSLLMAIIGVSLEGTPLFVVLLVAVLLMLVHPRFMCFAYAGGLVALSGLLLGWPAVNVPGLMGLVALLHIVESFLIWATGGRFATPVYVRQGARIVGGFSLQKFWPLPLAVLFLFVAPGPLPPDGLIEMPDWWPLIRPVAALAEQPNAVYILFPVVAVLGYGDIAISAPPGVRTRRSALWLLAYSLVLLGLAIVASHLPLVGVLAAGFAIAGHELVVWRGLGAERTGRAHFAPAAGGVALLDVLPGSPAARLGLRSGDVIRKVNGRPVAGREDVREAMGSASFYLELEVERDGRTRTVETNRFPVGKDRTLGIVPVPEPDDPPHVELGAGAPLGRLDPLFKAVRGRFTRQG